MIYLETPISDILETTTLQTKYNFDEVSESEVLESELTDSINDLTEILIIKLKGGF